MGGNKGIPKHIGIHVYVAGEYSYIVFRPLSVSEDTT